MAQYLLSQENNYLIFKYGLIKYLGIFLNHSLMEHNLSCEKF